MSFPIPKRKVNVAIPFPWFPLAALKGFELFNGIKNRHDFDNALINWRIDLNPNLFMLHYFQAAPIPGSGKLDDRTSF